VSGIIVTVWFPVLMILFLPLALAAMSYTDSQSVFVRPPLNYQVGSCNNAGI